MDSLTQAALGAGLGGMVLGRRLGRSSVLIGAVLGTLPDLDVVIDYGDAVADYTYHRGFSHSLFVLGGLATLLAVAAARFAPMRDVSFRQWALFFGLCLLTHPLLDAFTTYGTQIWWPLDTPPTSWATIFIIDPLFSLPLLATLFIALARGHPQRIMTWGVAIACAYLAFTLVAKGVVESRLTPVLAEHGLGQAPRLVQPTPFNTLLWRATIIDDDAHHEVLVGLLDGDTSPLLESYSRGAELEDEALSFDAGARLSWFAGPFLRYEQREIEGHETLIATDLRLGFPGFHPFSFALAERRDGVWQAIDSRELDAPTRRDRQALTRLWQRIFSPEPPLCTTDLVDPQWIVERPAAC
ncbi:metal-dependent hydrolase [Aidingimonas lacisalsi]|uniref:metal-dependent hydrolase n=1 Tax=Aidingimonas lacisalsi TaxID=2604086 RepID=UPI0011D21DF2|nr:metal-dependent hydrolase [Aidingimonas lacisalsi]